MRLIYMAAPVSGDVKGNLAKAKRWLRYLQVTNPDDVIIAPWIFEVEHFAGNDDSDPEARERGLRHCERTAFACDEVWCVGIKSRYELTVGMQREGAACAEGNSLRENFEGGHCVWVGVVCPDA